MKFLFVLFAACSTFLSSAKSNPSDISPIVLESFQNTFNNAREVGWSVTSQFVKASFTFDGQHLNAFYNTSGELLALTRNIAVDALPVMLQGKLKKNMGNSWISGLFEVSNDEGTSYFITLEDADNVVVLQSHNNTEWTTYKKSRKA